MARSGLPGLSVRCEMRKCEMRRPDVGFRRLNAACEKCFFLSLSLSLSLSKGSYIFHMDGGKCASVSAAMLI